MKNITPHHQAGITLIELMIALALGLIVSAAAIMLFLTGQKSYSLQQGVADLQDSANFGLDYIVRDIRLSNLNTVSSEANDETSEGGIVLTSSVNGKKTKDAQTGDETLEANLPASLIGTTVAVALLSNSDDGLSNVNTEKSDQLVIQYKPQYMTDPDDATKLFGGFDCEGNRISFAATGPKRIIIQRYFLRKDNNKVSNEPNEALSLACDAGWYNETGNPTQIESYGDNGQIIIKRVDYFHIMLGIQNDTSFRYISVKDYMAITVTPRPRILSVQLAALIRSTQPVVNDGMIKDDQKFQVLEKEVTVKTPAAGSPKYVRQVVSQTIALRNTFGERGQSS